MTTRIIAWIPENLFQISENSIHNLERILVDYFIRPYVSLFQTRIRCLESVKNTKDKKVPILRIFLLSKIMSTIAM